MGLKGIRFSYRTQNKKGLLGVQVPLQHPSLRVVERAGQPDKADLAVPTLCGLCLFVRYRASRHDGLSHKYQGVGRSCYTWTVVRGANSL